MKAAVATLLVMVCAAAGTAPREVSTGTLVPGKEPSAPVGTTGKYVRGPETTEVMPSDAAIASARAMARCAVAKQPAEVQVALNAADRDSFRVASQKLSSTLGRCAGSTAEDGVTKVQFGFGASTYIGLLAEAWLIKRGMLPLEPGAYTGETTPFDWSSRGVGDSVVLRLADCLAHKEPQRVEALVRSPPSTPQEAAGFASIRPTLPACLESNVTLNATKTKLRLALASALYKRSTNPEVQQAEARR